jgi:phosphoribosylformylglycinamidine (FGAM) synthase-like amidotransferase family enzyme
MAQFSDLEFKALDNGFESNYVFDNFFQIHVTAGPSRFTLDSEAEAELTIETSADAYNAFDCKVFDGVTQQDDSAWLSGYTKDQVTALMADVEGRAAVYVPDAE